MTGGSIPIAKAGSSRRGERRQGRLRLLHLPGLELVVSSLELLALDTRLLRLPRLPEEPACQGDEPDQQGHDRDPAPTTPRSRDLIATQFLVDLAHKGFVGSGGRYGQEGTPDGERRVLSRRTV